MSSIMSCTICCSDYNKSTRKCITCPSGCEFSACKECIRKYLITNTKDPHCMNCSAMWSFRFCSETLNKSFMTSQYTEHRSGILLEREISMIPDTMDLAGRRQTINTIRKSQRDLVEERNALAKQMTIINNKYAKLNEEIYILERKTKSENRKFIMPCPGETCRGFLSTQYKCEICCLWTCKHCCCIIGESKDDPHECSEEAVASAELIKQSTRPCPTCGIRITKISGCDQMWCVECRTAFSWNTGMIETGVVHNPHFYEYREINRGDQDGGNRPLTMCDNDNVVPFQTFSRTIIIPIQRFYEKRGDAIPNEVVVVQSVYAIYAHMTHYEINGARRDIRAYGNNEYHRVEYILGHITKEEFKSTISNHDKKRRRLVEVTNVTEVFCEVSKDVINSITNFPTPDMNDLDELIKHIFVCYTQLNKIREYCNRQWQEISAANGITTHYITEMFGLQRQKCGVKELHNQRMKESSP